jgi:hypothetical protein
MFNMDKLHFYLNRQHFHNNIEVHIGTPSPLPRRWSVAQPLTFTEQPEGTAYTEPVMVLSQKDAQQLMDELWQCGLRPSEGTGSAGAMAAVQKHLEDMRTLVFKEKSIKEKRNE